MLKLEAKLVPKYNENCDKTFNFLLFFNYSCFYIFYVFLCYLKREEDGGSWKTPPYVSNVFWLLCRLL